MVAKCTKEKEAEVGSSATDGGPARTKGAERGGGKAERGGRQGVESLAGKEILAGWQRVSEAGSATKSHGSPSSSAPHLSGRHAITGFVYMGLCTYWEPWRKQRMRCRRCDVCVMNNCPIMLRPLLLLLLCRKSFWVSPHFLGADLVTAAAVTWLSDCAATDHRCVGLCAQYILKCCNGLLLLQLNV